MLGSQFFITLGEDLEYLDAEHCVFGEVTTAPILTLVIPHCSHNYTSPTSPTSQPHHPGGVQRPGDAKVQLRDS